MTNLDKLMNWKLAGKEDEQRDFTAEIRTSGATARLQIVLRYRLRGEQFKIDRTQESTADARLSDFVGEMIDRAVREYESALASGALPC